MKLLPICTLLALALCIPGAHAADAGIFSIVEGQARVLRDTTWYRLIPGARFQEGDILVAKGAGQIQVELTAGGTFNLGTPGTLFAAAIPALGDKSAGPAELSLREGWLKFAAAAPSGGFRIQFDTASLLASESIVVMHAQPGAVEMFVESGSANLLDAGQGAAKAPAATELKAGEFAALSVERPARFERRAPPTFVAAIPRYLIDPLPALAAKYKAAKVQMVAEQEINYAEAAPWLAGRYRKSFLKRFQPRLKDRDFRAAVDAHIALYPEWDRIMHPEKYRPKVPVEAK